MLWYPKIGGVKFEDVNGEKEMSIIYTDTKNYTSNDLKGYFNRLAGYQQIILNA